MKKKSRQIERSSAQCSLYVNKVSRSFFMILFVCLFWTRWRLMSSKDQGPVYSSRRSLTRVNAWSYLCWVLLWPVVQAFPQEVPSLPYLSIVLMCRHVTPA